MIEKDHQLLAGVAVHSPHIAGTVLRLLNDLEDARRLGELPPAELLQSLGRYVELLGQLMTALGETRRQTVDRAGVLGGTDPPCRPVNDGIPAVGWARPSAYRRREPGQGN